jgi:hypothetical protein
MFYDQWKCTPSAVETVVVDEQYDSDIEREKSINYTSRADMMDDIEPSDLPKDEVAANTGMFQLGGGTDTVKASRPCNFIRITRFYGD